MTHTERELALGAELIAPENIAVKVYPIAGGHQVAASDIDSGQPIGTVTFKKKEAALAYALKFFFDPSGTR